MEYLPDNKILKFNPDTLEHVRNCYDLDQSRINQGLNILEEWIQKQQHFIKKDFDRGYLERVIIRSKGSIEKAKSQIDKMCTMRTLLPRYFEELTAKEDIKAAMDGCSLTPLPKMTKDHNRVYWLKLDHANITPENFISYSRLSIIVNEYLTSHDYYKGIILIEDYRGANALEIMSKLSVFDLQELMSVIIEGYGARLLEIHIITESKLVDLIIKFAKQFLSSKIASRIKIHENAEGIHKYVDRTILPLELGGTEKSLTEIKNEWVDVLSEETHIEYVKMMNKARTNENYRLEERFNNMYLGTPGSFRNLRVD